MNNEEITGLPPAFDATQKLSDEEMIDVILFGAPRAWQNEMDRQGFDPMEKTPGEVIAFMENMEATEDRPDSSQKSNSTTKKETKKTKKPKKSGNSNGGKTKCHCTEHGKNWTHDTKDCRALQNKAKGNNNNNSRFQNKTWNRKSEEAKKEAVKELATLIAKQVKKGVKKKQLSAVDKKQKNDDDSDSDEDCAPLQGLTGGFNCEQVENLSIDDDEVSC